VKHKISHILVVGLIFCTMATSIVAVQDASPTRSTSDNQLIRLELSPTVQVVEWSPDGSLLAVSQGDVVGIWDVETGEELRTFEGDTFFVTSLAWSPDGNKLAALGNRVVVWGLNTGQNFDVLEFPDNEANAGTVDWSPDSENLALIRWNYDPDNPFGKITQIWYESTNEVTNLGNRLSHDQPAAKWSPDGKMIAISDNDSIGIWDVTSGEVLREFDNVADVTDMAWSPDDTQLAFGTSKGIDPSHDDTEGYNFSRVIQIRDIQTGKVLVEMDGHMNRVLSIDWSRNGKLIASGGQDRTVRIWDVETGQLAVLIEEHPDSVNSVAWSPDSKILASGSNDGTAIVWDVQGLLAANE
jgi:WD40 repeat protein